MNRHRNNDFKNIIIAILFLAIVFMTAGYAAYSRDLVINGEGKIYSDWDVQFTDVYLDYLNSTLSENAAGGAIEVEQPKIADDGLSMTMSVAMIYNTDKVSYEVDITNFSEKWDAEYTGLIINTDSETDYILYEVNGITVGDKIQADASNGSNPNETTITVTAYWNPAKRMTEPAGVLDLEHLDTTYTETATITLAFEAAKPN